MIYVYILYIYLDIWLVYIYLYEEPQILHCNYMCSYKYIPLNIKKNTICTCRPDCWHSDPLLCRGYFKMYIIYYYSIVRPFLNFGQTKNGRFLRNGRFRPIRPYLTISYFSHHLGRILWTFWIKQRSESQTADTSSQQIYSNWCAQHLESAAVKKLFVIYFSFV